MKFTALLILLFSVVSLSAQTQKRPLTTNDVLKWNRITETVIANNGKFIVYKQEPWRGDAEVKITTPKGEEITSVIGANGAKITADSKFVLFTQQALEDTVRALKLKKTKKEDMPQNKLVIYNLENKSSETIEKIKTWSVPEDWSGFVFWQAEAPKDTTQKSEKGKPGKGSKTEEIFPLTIKNTESGEIETIPDVAEFVLAEQKEMIAFAVQGKDSTIASGVFLMDLISGNKIAVFEGKEKVEKLTLNKTGTKLAFFTEDSKQKENFILQVWEKENGLSTVADNSAEIKVGDWMISNNSSLSFSEDNTRLFFGNARKKAPKDTTILEEEIPVLDIWHWNEEELQTVQLNNKRRDERKTYLAVYDLDKKNIVQLETEEFSGIRMINKGDANKFLAWSNRPYAVQTMWEGSPRHNDFYLVDVKNGKAELIKKDVRANPMVSPAGKYIYWYNAMDTTWNTYEIETGKEYKISTPDVIQIADELNDIPNPPGSYSTGGWLNNDESILINDRFDIWMVDPKNRIAPFNFTQNGRENKTSFRIMNLENNRSRFSRENEEGIDPEKPMFLKAHNEKTRADSYYKYELKNRKAAKQLFAENKQLSNLSKAKNTDLVVFTKEDFNTYPNLIATDLSFKKQTQISNAAPQQDEFYWGTAELVSWISLDGIKLEGTLHKPENFDPSKKYPMIVNFYEKSSQELLSYRMPELHRSTIDYHLYTSNGYVVFNPDVYYKEGYPGESAFNCVMPGVAAVLAKGFIDKDKIGAQGHSWGGYQVAYLATRTNLFAAIESGAPVVNMFSAYGGIRWGSGLNRSFQYEHTQSRIGKSIWEAPLRYLENSPLFTLDKVETPLLIMHNDDDGAVPWYQGIEYFIGLRRLGKPAWLLNYNEADHWPLKVRDKEDFQIRMAQFFNHYLKGEPMPKWMKEGIPAVNKGIDLGYELSK